MSGEQRSALIMALLLTDSGQPERVLALFDSYWVV
jgi:hypothetical protein